MTAPYGRLAEPMILGAKQVKRALGMSKNRKLERAVAERIAGLNSHELAACGNVRLEILEVGVVE